MDNVAEAIADLKRQLAALEATVAPAPQTETLFPDAEPDDTAEPEVTLADWLDHRGITNYQTVAALVRWAAAAPLPTTATHKAWATICTPERGVPLEWLERTARWARQAYKATRRVANKGVPLSATEFGVAAAETGLMPGFLETFTADGSGYPEVFVSIREAFPAATTMDVVVAISELHDSHHRATS